MRVTVNGYHRDHGSKILIDKDLSDVSVDNNDYSYHYCPYDRPIIRTHAADNTTELGDSHISIVTRVNTTLQGNYRFEIRLTLSDIVTLFWLGFKDKALDKVLQLAFQNKAKLTETATPTAAIASAPVLDLPTITRRL